MGETLTHVEDAIKYCEDVTRDRIDACQWTKLACQRQLEDLERTDWDYEWNPLLAERVCRFIELLPHIKGKWAGDNIILQPWQKFILTTIFGWVHKEDKTRRFRTTYIEVPRKNAKSTITSAVALYMMALDNEGGAECYSCATTRDQARIVFQDAQQMVRKSPEFRERFGLAVHAHAISQLSTASRFQALSAEGSTLDGLNVHFASVDELHAHKTRTVFDVISSARGSRSQPLLWCITTAGSNRAGVCYEQRMYVTKLLQRVHHDETYFGAIWTLDEDDDWTDPAVWAKANPNFGVSVYPESIASECLRAQQMPAAQNEFLTKYLNVWVNADTAWMNMLEWERCGDAKLSIEDFEGEPCYLGMDLASRNDIAALLALFERDGIYYAFGRYYLPEETVATATNAQYSGWARDGRLVVTPGNVIDFDYIEQDVRDISSRFEITELAYDPFQATQFSTRMIAEGFPMVEMRPTVLNFSEPMKNLEALVLERKLRHDACPVLTWMISNVVGHLDAKDNIYPRKPSPEAKIDGVVALIMAVGRAITREQLRDPYKERGMLFL